MKNFTLLSVSFLSLLSFSFQKSQAQLALQCTEKKTVYKTLVKNFHLEQSQQDDQLTDAIHLPFEIKLDGVNYTDCKISSNGWLTLGIGSTSNANANNLAITSTSVQPPIIAPYWDNLITDSIKTAVLGEAPNRQFIVEWKNVKFGNHDTKDLSFETIFFEADNAIDFVYNKISDRKNIENGGASIGIRGIADRNDFISIDLNNDKTIANYGKQNAHINFIPANNQTYHFQSLRNIAPAGIVDGLCAWWQADEKYFSENDDKVIAWRQVNNQNCFLQKDEMNAPELLKMDESKKENNFHVGLKLTDDKTFVAAINKKMAAQLQSFYAVVNNEIVSGKAFDEHHFFTTSKSITDRNVDLKIGEGLLKNGNSIEEIILFNRDLNEDEKAKLETYLSLKYGLATENPALFLASNYEQIWNEKTNEFANYMAIIGRDDEQSFYQNIAANRATNEALTVKSEVVDNISFLMWGSNAKRNSFEKPIFNNEKVETVSADVYQFHLKNYHQKPTLIFNKKMLKDAVDNDLVLLLSDKTDFADANILSSKPTIENGQIVFSDVDLGNSSTVYLRLAITKSTSAISITNEIVCNDCEDKIELLNSPEAPVLKIVSAPNQSENYSLEVFNEAGQLIQPAFNFSLDASSTQFIPVDLSGAAHGLYLAVLSNNVQKRKKTFKILR